MEFRRITVDPDKLGGVPCIRGLRIPAATVVGRVADGMTPNEIVEAYPDLEPEDIEEALRYSAEALNERTLPLYPRGDRRRTLAPGRGGSLRSGTLRVLDLTHLGPTLHRLASGAARGASQARDHKPCSDMEPKPDSDMEPPTYLYKYLRYSEGLIDLFAKRAIKFTAPQDFNDPLDCMIEPLWDTAGQETLGRDAIERARGCYGVLSLSEEPLSVTMWTHYAQNHEGLCVQLSTRGNQFFGRAKKVRYLEHYPGFHALETPMSEQYDKIFLTKSPEWSSEREWRLVHHAGPGNYPFPPDALTGVIFGLRTPASTRDRVASWLEDGPPVQTSQVELVPRTFRLQLATTP